MKYKLLITTSWTWSRLWDLTKETNKGLIKLWWKEILAHIIDTYPSDIDIVVALWYFWEKVKNFLIERYPMRNITYSYVDIYEWPWSSLGYSMLCTKEYLQCPFIFHCNDTIVNTYMPSVSENRAGWYKVTDSAQYTTFKTNGDNIILYNKVKWASDYDYAHIWLVWMYEYEKYWNILDSLYKENPNDSALNDVKVLYEMLHSWSHIGFIGFTKWLDTGNLEALDHAQKNI